MNLEVTGYKKISEGVLHSYIEKAYENYLSGGKSLPHAAVALGKSTQTIRYCIGKKTNLVSDEVLSKFFELVQIDGFIVIKNGVRFFYIKN